MRKLHLADLTTQQPTTNEKPPFAATLSSTEPATKRTNLDSLSSYRRQFTPMLLLETVRLEGSVQKQQTQQAKRKLTYDEEPAREKQNTSKHVNLELRSTRVNLHNLKRELLDSQLERYRPALNLEYEIRKKRFFQTFGRGKSYTHLSKYRQ